MYIYIYFFFAFSTCIPVFENSNGVSPDFLWRFNIQLVHKGLKKLLILIKLSTDKLKNVINFLSQHSCLNCSPSAGIERTFRD